MVKEYDAVANENSPIGHLLIHLESSSQSWQLYSRKTETSNNINFSDGIVVVLLHVSLLVFLASNWQAPNKVEQLQQLQKELSPKLKAFLYQVPVQKKVEPFIPQIKPQTVKEPEVQTAAESVKEIQKVEPLETTNTDEPQNKPEKVPQKPFNFKAATQAYMQKQQQQKFGELKFGNEQYQYGSVSEMTPQMKQEWLPERKTAADKKTLDHRLDPNRIVREGHVCRRVVKIIDPIGGDKESLGYPFKCGKTDQEKALAASLEKYIKKKR